MLKSYLLENYGYNEPIFLNHLKIDELSENALRQSVKRLVANGFLEQGYHVDAIGGFGELCKLASKYTGIELKNEVRNNGSI